MQGERFVVVPVSQHQHQDQDQGVVEAAVVSDRPTPEEEPGGGVAGAAGAGGGVAGAGGGVAPAGAGGGGTAGAGSGEAGAGGGTAAGAAGSDRGVAGAGGQQQHPDALVPILEYSREPNKYGESYYDAALLNNLLFYLYYSTVYSSIVLLYCIYCESHVILQKTQLTQHN